jgi:hypothetical protein
MIYQLNLPECRTIDIEYAVGELPQPGCYVVHDQKRYLVHTVNYVTEGRRQVKVVVNAS